MLPGGPGSPPAARPPPVAGPITGPATGLLTPVNARDQLQPLVDPQPSQT